MTVDILRALRGRSTAELTDRARQALSRALERTGIGDVSEPAGTTLDALVDLDGTVWPARVQGPFFASLDDRERTLGALREVDARFEAKLEVRANAILEGRHDLLGHRGLSFGTPPDWWLDPLTGARAPRLHWSRIDFLDPAVLGDHKVVWELSRHQELLALAQAWYCGKDERYLDVLSAWLTDWLDRNPPKLGPNWASSLELALRGYTWLWILALAGESLPPELCRRMVAVLAVAARHIERYLSTWFSPNTHLTGEALGLFMIGTALPQCRDAARWRAMGASILLDWLGRHVRPDGTYIEQSTWYHRYTTDFYLHFLVLAERSGLDVRERVARPLAGLLDHLQWIARPDGSMPLVGDDDGGRLLFLDERTARDVRTPLAVGAVLLARGDFARAAGDPSTELVWLLGPDAPGRLAALPREVPPHRRRGFADGGCYVMRSGWDQAASVMTIDAGPHGFLNGGHAHADALSIDLCVGGVPLLIDPGTFTYTVSAEWRDRFRHTASHCAAVVDGCGSAVPSGPFQWSTRAESRCLAWHDAGSVAVFVGTHDGYAGLRPAVTYRRVVAFVEPDLWIVRDELNGEDDHELAVHWQCASGLDAQLEGVAVVVRRKGVGLAVMQVAEDGGEWTAAGGWVSPAYGVREPGTHLRHVRRGRGRLALTTVLVAGGERPSVTMRDAPDTTSAVEVAWGMRRGVLATSEREAAPDGTGGTITWSEPAAGLSVTVRTGPPLP